MIGDFAINPLHGCIRATLWQGSRNTRRPSLTEQDPRKYKSLIDRRIRSDNPRYLSQRFHIPFALLFFVEASFALVVAWSAIRAGGSNSGFGQGVIWVLIGVVALCASYALSRDKQWCLHPSLAAAIAGILINFYVVWAAYRSPTARPWSYSAWLGALLFLGVAIAVGRAMHLSPVRNSRAAFATILSLAGIGQFWYSTQYAPTLDAPSLSVTSTLSIAPLQNGLSTSPGPVNPVDPRDPVAAMIPVDATITVHNTSHARVQVIHSIFKLAGSSLVTHADHSPATGQASERATRVSRAFGWVLDMPAYLGNIVPSTTGPDLLATGQVTKVIEYFDPGEEWSTHLVLFVPKDTYRVVQLSVELEVAKAVQLTLDPPTLCDGNTIQGPVNPVQVDVPNGQVTYSCIRRRLGLPNQIFRWVAGVPYVRTELILIDTSSPAPSSSYPQVHSFLGTASSFNGHYRPDIDQRLSTKYSVTEAESLVQLFLPASYTCPETSCAR
jgi:hypothetical protein